MDVCWAAEVLCFMTSIQLVLTTELLSMLRHQVSPQAASCPAECDTLPCSCCSSLAWIDSCKTVSLVW